MRFHLGLGSKAKRLFLSSPSKKKIKNGENPVGELGFKDSKPVVLSGLGFSDFGNKDEIFFDSKAWLDSDCEDDFFSVNGDFTPSRGSTPIHHLSIPATPQANKSVHLPSAPDSKSSPTDGKKKLLDFLEETSQVDDMGNDQNAEANGKTSRRPASVDSSPHPSGTNSVWSSEATPVRETRMVRKERSARTRHCCFPGFMPSRRFSDRRKEKMTPALVT